MGHLEILQKLDKVAKVKDHVTPKFEFDKQFEVLIEWRQEWDASGSKLPALNWYVRPCKAVTYMGIGIYDQKESVKFR